MTVKYYVIVMVQSAEQAEKMLNQKEELCFDAQNLVYLPFDKVANAIKVKDNCVELVRAARNLMDFPKD